ncbi:hypothetical protein SAICODRAFT_4810 [Saitoella complicata NRRL Y-17804]|uniref:Vacuolar protein sorting-associated protein 51 homolog n=1 Tax=Saitoella complicata (strain BCRC 22490 / CBS 7301 / JCM 7358 / NBRC 10748 / NRRL Y-17804) TaxID=698492 RepID=A0A0E9NS94_SAICN|nr:uncharacterized protein SAICODRAFT_4810 [Saitoella complicata NRRL Y-17804]ODQ55570.1 hypothetical protein SAICODRAFT_4810 [Saitoella complicata NRRL Y-17804]GAO52767.1 hypothetical protein G7K_6835-t1 [Saitoella complicata NRRL Y-17804]
MDVKSPPSTPRSTASRLTSDLQTARRGAGSGVATPVNAKTKRKALREFYGLNEAMKREKTAIPEIDLPDFNPQSYVNDLLKTKNLKELLTVENTLVKEIRGLDGERKSLVYDNYSKLMHAASTIRKMRQSIDPVAPSTDMLGAAIEKIQRLSGVARQKTSEQNNGEVLTEDADLARQREELVTWVRQSPQRLEELLQHGNTEEAERQWTKVQGILDRWSEVRGVKDLRERCEAAMNHGAPTPPPKQNATEADD